VGGKRRTAECHLQKGDGHGKGRDYSAERGSVYGKYVQW